MMIVAMTVGMTAVVRHRRAIHQRSEQDQNHGSGCMG
jgi:hypothetical protein